MNGCLLIYQELKICVFRTVLNFTMLGLRDFSYCGKNMGIFRLRNKCFMSLNKAKLKYGAIAIFLKYSLPHRMAHNK